ncbi:hypothetical protein GF319_08050 [Candidatus Bathyarchaeota archaeon]|nr:hypothetical protein [Candidatus Bathyarchaeota archaeon]
MRQIQSTVVGIIALIILVFIISQARRISSPFPFTIIGVLMAILIIINIARTWVRGY